MQAIDLAAAGKDRSGETIAGRYRIEQVLSRGGQGLIYRATDVKAGDEVAIKVLSDSFAESPVWRERLIREGQAMVALQNTSAVRVYDQQWTDDGKLCLVMELLRGVDLDQHLAEREEQGQRMSLAELVNLLTPVATTLEVAHSANIVHRDLKPANIFVLDPSALGSDSPSRVRLLDFGFAKFVRMRGLTGPGFVAGSPSYIAPEGWSGDSTVLDHRADVYGLAAVVYRCLCGAPPFTAESIIDLIRTVTTAPRPKLRTFRPDLPPDIDDWAAQALAIAPNDRFLRVSGMWAALTQLA